MKSKLNIINVDLGMSVQDLIDKEVEIFTGETKKLVEKMVEEQKHVQQTKQKIEDEKRQSNNLLELVFSELEAAGDNGMPVDQVWERVKNTITTPSAFTLKIKNMILAKGLKKMFVRLKINKVEHYVLR